MGDVVKLFPPNVHPQAYYTYIAQKYNLCGLYYMDLWPLGPAQLILVSPETAHQVTVLKSLPKHKMESEFLGPLIKENNIATSNNPLWKHLHNMLAPTFAPAHIKNQVSVMVEEFLHFRDTLGRLADSGEVFRLEDHTAAAVFDIIGRITFNERLHAQAGGSEYLRNLRVMMANFIATNQTWNPVKKFTAKRALRNVRRKVDQSLGRTVKERHRLLRDSKVVPTKKDPYSILDLFLRDKLKECQEKGLPDSVELDPEFVDLAVQNLKALLIGGQGTTTSTICWAYMLLSCYPDVAQKLRDEHARVFDPSTDRTVEILRHEPYKTNKLEYTTAVLRETLRLYPVGFGIRVGNEDSTVQWEGRHYPTANLMIAPVQHSMHYDPTIYHNPAEFNPERFVDPDHATQFGWRPFERGPRKCAGQELALEEMRIALLLTVRDFDFEAVDVQPNSTQRVPFTDFDLKIGDMAFQELGMDAKPRGGMKMRVRRRAR
ncbi:cytochrome P450 [Eremomyces bilateralis CBS 781.70]|uniref:Cytochrome P450 n=1 Tax=Eremomyces bilateralis CBS 781.70 TaxID=1392243 RepID=A0A6G1G5W1_9PEZI|nr:cytochrome P450 [Eremomyces bilateralis CBS 781.70]KAF1813453.1 cytochrome P450 [Eremomyces bilateralis CBS 781.70]